jgi:hypothetical protein
MKLESAIAWLTQFVGLGSPVPKTKVLAYHKGKSTQPMVEQILRSKPQMIRPTDFQRERWPKDWNKGKARREARLAWLKLV